MVGGRALSWRRNFLRITLVGTTGCFIRAVAIPTVLFHGLLLAMVILCITVNLFFTAPKSSPLTNIVRKRLTPRRAVWRVFGF